MRVYCVVLMLLPLIAPGNCGTIQPIISPQTISQTGSFKINHSSPLILDVKSSASTTNFVAFRELSSDKLFYLGAIPGDNHLQNNCEHPNFLIDEQIMENFTINNIRYFKEKSYSGCIVSLNDNKSTMIIQRPKPFVHNISDPIRYVGIVGETNEVEKLQARISFEISASEYFINLLQISQGFSPFSQEIDWNNIKDAGINWIGTETEMCRGLSAAAQFLIPTLYKLDFHSSFSLQGLGSHSCPIPPASEAESMKKWYALPDYLKKPIIQYTATFHGKNINNRLSYLYIPAIEYDPRTTNQTTKQGRDVLKSTNLARNCGLIVDLRFNFGGNTQPMLLTLGGILPAGTLYYGGKDNPIILSEDGNTIQPYGSFDGQPPDLMRNKPVAVITNWLTGSSGALVRLALGDNMAKVKTFGSETDSSVSVNQTMALLDGKNVINLMVDRISNKEGHKVPLKLGVEEEIDDDLEHVFQPNDLSIKAAIDWLQSLPECN